MKRKTITFNDSDFPDIIEVKDTLYDDILNIINSGKKVSEYNLSRYFNVPRHRISYILQKLENNNIVKSQKVRAKDVSGNLTKIRIYYK